MCNKICHNNSSKYIIITMIVKYDTTTIIVNISTIDIFIITIVTNILYYSIFMIDIL
jgi:hypothetical protein